jgi:hypothetical protein
MPTESQLHLFVDQCPRPLRQRGHVYCGCPKTYVPFEVTDYSGYPEYQAMKAYRPTYVAAGEALGRLDTLWEQVRGVRMDLPPFYPEKEWPARAKAMGYDAAEHERVRAEYKRVAAHYEALKVAWGLIYVDLP